ncbi:MAG: metalloregulator ArsR/SmtB family transcription factor [Candidatus Bathyarchaeia archaeon]
MKASVLTERLGRLIAEGRCRAGDAALHVEELRSLVRKAIDERAVRMESKVFKALSDESRLKMVKLLAARELCVCEVMAALDMTQPTASHHLNILEDAGLLRGRREGKWTFYGIAEPSLIDLIDQIGKVSG